MKKHAFQLLHARTLLLFFMCSQTLQSQTDLPCQTFNDGATGGWQTILSSLNVQAPGPSGLPGDSYIHSTDSEGASYIFNNTNWNLDYTRFFNSCLCFDFQLEFDGGLGSAIHPTIDIIAGPPGQPTLAARFVATVSITAEDGWVHVCAPIEPCDAQGNLPSNSEGEWQWLVGSSCQDWINLLSSPNNGLRFLIDLTSSPTEQYGYDNICFEPCEAPCLTAAVSNITCINGGTADPSDDHWTFDLLVNGGQPGSYWYTSTPPGEAGAFNVLKTIWMGPIANYPPGSTVTFQVFDSQDPNCSATVEVPVPRSCSAPCDLEISYAFTKCVYKNGQWYYSVVLTVSGSNGECWMAKQKLPDGTEVVLYTGSGDTQVTLGPFPAGQDWTLWVFLCEQMDCIVDAYIDAPDCRKYPTERRPAHGDHPETTDEFFCPVEGSSDPEPATGGTRSEGGDNCFGNDLSCTWRSPKTLKLLFHVIRDEDGLHNFDPAYEQILVDIVNTANAKLANNQPASNPGNPATPLMDINIQYELADVLYYDQEHWAYPDITYPPANPNFLNVYFNENAGEWFGTGCNDPNYCTGQFCCAGGWAPVGVVNGRVVINRAFFRYVYETILPGCVNAHPNFDAAFSSHYADVLIHEIGHILGLVHLNQNDGCNDTPLMSDVCATNNFMSGCACTKGNFTCCQIEKMHNKLEATTPAYLEQGGYCESSFQILTQGCTYYFFNNSTSSDGGECETAQWCIKNLGRQTISKYEGHNLIFNPPCNGDFEVCLYIEDSNGCQDISCQTFTVTCAHCSCAQPPCLEPTDRNDSAAASQLQPDRFRVFPNPAAEQLAIEQLEAPLSEQARLIVVYDMLGQVVYRQALQADWSRLSVDVRQLPVGVYVLKLYSDQAELYNSTVLIAR